MRVRHLTRAVAVAAAAAALTLTAACGGTGTVVSGATTLTVYSADGLGSWYKSQFAAYQKQTGVAVNVVEAGSGEVVSRVQKEQSNPQADLLVTLPPFIQRADADKLLQSSGVQDAAIAQGNNAADGNYVAIVDNTLSFIANPSAQPAPRTWDDLLASQYKGKIQYSTPGQAGDGTAVLLLLQHLMGNQQALDYLAKLQTNNVGPSSSTGKLQPKVSNGELLVANGDVQMNLAPSATTARSSPCSSRPCPTAPAPPSRSPTSPVSPRVHRMRKRPRNYSPTWSARTCRTPSPPTRWVSRSAPT